MKIKCSLWDIDSAIAEIETYRKELNKKVTMLVEKLAEYGMIEARIQIADFSAVDSGELYASMMYYMKDSNTAVIFTDCGHAAYVEFGTGIIGSRSPHPSQPWAYDINSHGDDGWYYFKNNRWNWTAGFESRPFMYHTAEELKRNAKRIAQEVFR